MTMSNEAAKLSPHTTVDVESELLCPHCRTRVRLALVSVEQTDNPKSPTIVPMARVPETVLRNEEESQLITPLATVEKHAILAAMRETGNNWRLTCRMLGIGKTTLYRKLKEYGFKSAPQTPATP